MRDLYLILGMAAVALVIGVGLFFFGPASLKSDFSNALQPTTSMATSSVQFTVIAKGLLAYTINDRSNYRITSQGDYKNLWTLIYGAVDAPKMPYVDFSKYDLLGVFDGSHSTTGYSIAVQSVSDSNSTRMVTIVHTVPGAQCGEQVTLASPFELIAVPKSDFQLAHRDIVSTTTCP